jgi:hypothetical protein
MEAVDFFEGRIFLQLNAVITQNTQVCVKNCILFYLIML